MRTRWTSLAVLTLALLPVLPAFASELLGVTQVGSDRNGLVVIYQVRITARSARVAARDAGPAVCRAGANDVFVAESPARIAAALKRIGPRGCAAAIESTEVLSSEALGGTYAYLVKVRSNVRQLQRQLEAAGLSRGDSGLGPVILVFEELRVPSWAGGPVVEEKMLEDWRKEVIDTQEAMLRSRGHAVVSRGEVDAKLLEEGARGGLLEQPVRRRVLEWAVEKGAETLVEVKVLPRTEGGRTYWTASVSLRRLDDARVVGSAVGASAHLAEGVMPTIHLLQAAVGEAVNDALEQAIQAGR